MHWFEIIEEAPGTHALLIQQNQSESNRYAQQLTAHLPLPDLEGIALEVVCAVHLKRE
jgi:hypothetical protein